MWLIKQLGPIVGYIKWPKPWWASHLSLVGKPYKYPLQVRVSIIFLEIVVFHLQRERERERA